MKHLSRLFLFLLVLLPSHATPRKVHTVLLGAAKRVPYSKAGDPARAATGETILKIRPLLVDTILKEWTTGDATMSPTAASSSAASSASTTH